MLRRKLYYPLSSFLITFLVFSYVIPLEHAYAQDTLNKKEGLIKYYEMSIEELQKVRAMGVSSELEKLINSLIAVASKKALSTRESPGIVTLITEEEIKSSGARDLVDVLQLVPGIDFGMDVQNTIGVGSRGNWGHEGKILMLLDGQEMNDLLWATLQFGNHFPVEQIKKIEIIRGPGSAIYGGFAEYGVINVVTKNGADLQGISLTGIYGQMVKEMGRSNIGLAAGNRWKDLDVSVSAFAGKGNRSDRDFTDFYGTSYNTAGNSDLNPNQLNMGVKYKNLTFRGIADVYKNTTRDAFGTNLTAAYPNDFYSYHADLRYNINLMDSKLVITPRLNYIRQIPWLWKGPSNDEYTAYDKLVERKKANISANYTFSRRVNWMLGGEFYQDKATDRVDSSFFYNGKSTVQYDNIAVFSEALLKLRPVNITLGGRYDRHTQYGAAYSPRIALTKKIRRLHFKALYSHAFRAPAIENINFGAKDTVTGEPILKPEKTKVAELEIGYQLTRKMILTVNLFDITTKDPIVYWGTSSANQAYQNYEETGSQGFEVEFKVKDKWGYLNVNYSFYTAANKGKPETYAIPQDKSYMLAFPRHKVNLHSSLRITPKFSVNPSVLFRGARYGYNSMDTAEVAVMKKFDPSLFVNIYLKYDHLFVKGLSCGIGVYDIFNEGILFIQPYNSFHAPLPGPSREIFIRLAYDLNIQNLKKK